MYNRPILFITFSFVLKTFFDKTRANPLELELFASAMLHPWSLFLGLQDVSASIRFGQKKTWTFRPKAWTIRPEKVDVSVKKDFNKI